MKTRRLQYTKGWDGEVLVAANKAYTAQTPYHTNFVDNGTEGEMGIFNASSLALITGALPANTPFFASIKRGGLVSPLTTIKNDSNLVITKAVGIVPTTQVTTVVVTCGGQSDCTSCNCCTDTLVNYTFGILDTQTSDFAFEGRDYYLSGKRGRTIAQLLAAMQIMINDTTQGMNKNLGQVVQMSTPVVTGGATATDPLVYTFTFTGVGDFLYKPFKVIAKGFCNVSITNTTIGSEGLNTIADVVEADREMALRSGWGTERPGWPFKPEDFTVPAQFSSGQTGVFTSYLLQYKKHEPSTVVEQHVRNHNQMIFVPTGSALETSLNTIFGV